MRALLSLAIATFIEFSATAQWQQVLDDAYDNVSSIVEVNDKIYISLADIDPAVIACYDPANNTWLPIAAPEMTYGVWEMIASNGKIYIGGSFTNKVQIYDPGTDNWTTTETEPEADLVSALDVLDDIIYIGGLNNILVQYDPSTSIWSQVGINFIGGISDILVYDNILYAAKTDVTGDPASAFMKFDFETDIWIALDEGLELSDIKEIYPFNGKIYIAGDFTVNDSRGLAVYDPASGAISAIEGLDDDVRSVTSWNGGLAVAGGFTAPFDHNAIYYPSTNTWAAITTEPMDFISCLLGYGDYLYGGSLLGDPYNFARLYGATTVNETQKRSVKTYPNPAINRITIQFSSTPDLLKITNSIGETVFADGVVATTLNVDVSSWPPGLYYLIVDGLPNQKISVVH